MTRQIIKQSLRPLAEIAMVSVLGKGLPRRLRRQSGRSFANAAYRELSGLEWKGKAHIDVVRWIVKGYRDSLSEMPGVEPKVP